MSKQKTHALCERGYEHSLEVQCGIAARRVERRLGAALTKDEYQHFWALFLAYDRLSLRQTLQRAAFGYRFIGRKYLGTASEAYPLAYVARRAA